MAIKTVVDRCIKLVADGIGMDTSEVFLASEFLDLGMDSLDNVELLMACEDEFDIEIPDNDWKQILTVNQLVNYIEERLKNVIQGTVGS